MQFVGPRIKILSAALGQEMNRSTAQLDLTGSQSFFLHYLVAHRHQPVYPRDLEREFDFSHPTVSGILRRMETKGFITFRTGKNDRRCKQILLTEKAIKCHEAMLSNLLRTEEKVSNGLSPDERAALNRLLDKMIANMGAAVCCSPPFPEEDPA